MCKVFCEQQLLSGIALRLSIQRDPLFIPKPGNRRFPLGKTNTQGDSKKCKCLCHHDHDFGLAAHQCSLQQLSSQIHDSTEKGVSRGFRIFCSSFVHHSCENIKTKITTKRTSGDVELKPCGSLGHAFLLIEQSF